MSKAGDPIEGVTTLTFDIFGTVLDLAGSLSPSIETLLTSKNAEVGADDFWAQWRARQRIEQHQDTIMMLGHSGYLETCRRALLYCLRLNKIDFTDDDVGETMAAWQELSPFDDAVEGLPRLAGRYRLVALSNGEQPYLEHLVANRIKVQFADVISVERAGSFKPHPSVYRMATRVLGVEPAEVMMVAAHTFDIMGARGCGYRGALVDRYGTPAEESPYQPDLIVNDFVELAERLA